MELAAALRSGKYKQGRGVLRKGDRYCFWGVARDLLDGGEWVASTHGSVFWFRVPEKYAQNRALPPEVVTRRYGFEHPMLLAGLGDRGATFAELADAVELNCTEPLEQKYPRKQR